VDEDRTGWRGYAAISVACLALAALTRLPVMSRSVLDWDESLYFLIAEQWRAGHLPYTTIWDNKPVGIYAIFAVFQDVFGDRVAAIRLAAVGFSAVAAAAVCRITAVFTGALGAGLLAAGLYLLASLSNDGLASNTEGFMAAFTACAVVVALGGGRPLVVAWFAGLLAGAAFMTKYVSIFEDPAILVLLLLRHQRREALGVTAAVLAGGLLPVAAVAAVYGWAGRLPLWWGASIAANFRRVGAPVSPGALSYIWHVELWRWGPLYLAAAVMLGVAVARLRGKRTAERDHLLFLGLWLIGGSVGVGAAKSFYDHYFLQVLPALCVAFAWLAWLIRPLLPGWTGKVLLAGALVLPFGAAAAALRQAAAPQASSGIAAALRPLLAAMPGARVYVFDDQPIIYGLLHETPPTRYVLPSVLTDPFLSRVAGVDAPAEEARILASRPQFIICQTRPRLAPGVTDMPVYDEVAAALAAHYTLLMVQAGTSVYRRRAGG
jgi:4-amino-4-deoxy-L-arabinose transferase-like glycosyltransferase